MIDDGSTDDTLGISRSYAAQDKRVKTFHQANAGVSSARNHGIREAHGEYIIFLDSDDWLEDDAAEFMLNAQLQYPDKLITVSSYSVYFKNDGKLYRTKRKRSDEIQSFNLEQSMTQFGNIGLYSAYCKIFRTSIIRKHNIHFRQGIHLGEDTLFTFEYLHKTSGVICLNKALFDILDRPGSATKFECSHKMIKSAVRANELMINYPDNTPALREIVIASDVPQHLGSLSHMVIIGVSNDEIISMRQLARRYTREFMTSKLAIRRKKLSFIMKVLMPLPISKLVIFTVFYAKSIWRKLFTATPNNKHEELIADWLQ